MDLFTCESQTVFAFPPPESIREGDALWPAGASRRSNELEARRDDNCPPYLIGAADFAQYRGDFEKALAYSRRAQTLAAPGDGRVLVQGLLVQLTTYMAVADRVNAQRCADQIAELAEALSDPYLDAVLTFSHGLLPEGREGAADLDPNAVARISALLFEDAAHTFVACGDIDLAIRSLTKAARIKFGASRFFSAVQTIEDAAQLVWKHECWSHIGRLQAVVAGFASDQGYRNGMAERLRNAIAWSDYLGDVAGRIDGLVSLGRLLGYEMPSGIPSLVAEPDRYLRLALEEAEALGMTWVAANAQSIRTWLFDKAGADESQPVLQVDENREKLVAERVAEAKQVTAQIRLNVAARLHDGIEDSHDAFFVYEALRSDDGVCRDLNSMYGNRAANRIYAQTGSQVYLYSEGRVVPELQGLDDAILGATDRRESFEDVREVATNGESKWLQRRVVPSGDGAVLLLRDITAERSIESALRAAAESAERSERAKTAFLASMSHEIRTPLNGVLGLARMLSETRLDETQKAYLDDIVLSGDLLLALIGDVLDLSKIESHEMRLSSTSVSLPSLVASIVKLFRGQAQEKGTQLGFHIHAAVPETVQVDGVRLRQILANLVGNAVKFTHQGEVEIRVFAEEEFVVFEVRDTGIGIPPERLTHIFDRFQQASDPLYGGTGLGLTITKALTELMDGHVEVRSEVGHGSVFRVRLPLKEVVEVPSPVEPPEPKLFEGRRVLLVDDNRVNLLVSSYTLRKFGCEVVTAENGSKALDMLAQERFDMVFMDVRMPIMNGLEATQEIRRREGGGPRMPVVALTAGALLQEQQECFEAGMDDFATKPITSDSIGEVLARWL